MKQEHVAGFLPLSPKVFHLLMALADRPMNGYQLGQSIEETTDGALRLSPGSLYENIHRLKMRGLIEEISATVGDRRDGRGQRFYELTDLGLGVLRAEVARLTRDLATAKSIARLT